MECSGKDILADILEKQRSEVMDMLLTEYDEKYYKKLFYRDGREDGREEGREEERGEFQQAILLIAQGYDTEEKLLGQGICPEVAGTALETMLQVESIKNGKH